MTKQFDPEAIEAKLDRTTAGAVLVSDQVGGVLFKDMAQVMEFSKLLSLAGTAVPKHLRGNPGGCLAVTIQALEWHMSPIAVANKSYEVNDRIAYEAQLIHGVVEARAPLKQRLRFSFDGEGTKRFCTVSGHLKGEIDPCVYVSPTIERIKVKNSPLWTSDPDQQLSYYSARSWARRFCPDVLLGIYSIEEMEEGRDIRDVTPDKPDVGSRLKGGAKKRGFHQDNVEQLAHKPEEQKPEAAGTVTIIEPEPELAISAGDAETEIEAKKKAILAAETKEGIDGIVEAARDYLRQAKRPDLLNNLLTAQRDRFKQLRIEA